MSLSTEERLASLEQKFNNVEEGIGRLEKSLEKVANTVSELMEKLDARYSSQESVNLRFQQQQQEITQLQALAETLRADVEHMRRWQYKVMGAATVVAFLLGLVAEALRSWKG